MFHVIVCSLNTEQIVMKFNWVILIGAILCLSQFSSLANPIPDEGEHPAEDATVHECEGESCHELNTFNTFYKHWACSFTEHYLTILKKFTEDCSEALKELEGHEDAAKYENEKKDLEHIIQMYHDAENEEDKHKKFYMVYRIHNRIAKDMAHYKKPENKDHPVLQLLIKHGVKELIDDAHKKAVGYYHEFEEAFEKYLNDLTESQKESQAKLIHWFHEFKAKEEVAEKNKVFTDLFLFFDHNLEHDNDHDADKGEHGKDGE